MQKKVAIVILNWNGKKFLEDFLPFVIKHSEKDADIIVADNASGDGSVDFLKQKFPSVKVIINDSNGGYAKGYNDALKHVNAEYYVLLNSDIEVTSNWIKPVITLMDQDPDIACCQPRMRSFFEREKFEYAGAAGGFIDKYGYPMCRGRLFQSLEKDNGQYDDYSEVFWATGACLFVRSTVFKSLGGFDERFFAHMEEIDFCWRAKNNGYRIMYCPDSVVFHVGGGTLPKRSWKKTYLNMRNNIFMLYKNLPANRLFPVFATRLVLDGIASLKFLVDGGFMDFFAVLRAHLSFYRSLGELNAERKKLSQKVVSRMYMKNLVVEYFIKRKQKFTELDQKDFS